jgi:hypothetical protein
VHAADILQPFYSTPLQCPSKLNTEHGTKCLQQSDVTFGIHSHDFFKFSCCGETACGTAVSNDTLSILQMIDEWIRSIGGMINGSDQPMYSEKILVSLPSYPPRIPYGILGMKPLPHGEKHVTNSPSYSRTIVKTLRQQAWFEARQGNGNLRGNLLAKAQRSLTGATFYAEDGVTVFLQHACTHLRRYKMP